MTRAARERLAGLLRGDAQASSSCEVKQDPAGLTLHVEGFGRVNFPVGPSKARKLIELGHPARFGQGEETLTDREVRDTWEIPSRLVRAEWDPVALADILGCVKDELGLPNDAVLTASPHSLLIYEKGQFFAEHQDSEKSDGMIGTLTVTLPSTYDGGELIVSSGGEQKSYKGSRYLSIVAFFADCRHEVRQVTKGYRITLTYNLIMHGDAVRPEGDEGTITELASYLREHFSMPDSRRLAVLLDREYTPRALTWSLLKGADASRVALLRAAAGRAGCEAVLSLADVEETYAAVPAGGHFGPQSWYVENGDYYEDYDNDDDPDGEREYEIRDVRWSDVRLTHWMRPDGTGLEEISLLLGDTEVCAATPSADLTPFKSRYQGYMGNDGNTLDRWYHRAAVVIWPREQAFSNRAETSPAWALNEITAMVSAGDMTGARAAAGSLTPFWVKRPPNRAQEEDDVFAAFFAPAVRAADAVDHPGTAAILLRPFTVRHLTQAHAGLLAAATGRYGQAWTASLLQTWFGEERAGWEWHRQQWTQERLPGLCARLQATGDAGTMTARVLLDLSWERLRQDIAASLASPGDGYHGHLERLGKAVAAVLTAAAVVEAEDTRDAVSHYIQAQADPVAALELYTVRAAGNAHGQGPRNDDGFGDLAADCTARLHSWLAPAIQTRTPTRP